MPSEMSDRGRSPSPKPLRDVDMDMENGASQKDVKVVVVNGLSRNVVQTHLHTIFGFYGTIVKIDLPLYSKSGQNRGKAALEYADVASARKAVSHMNGGQLDGLVLKVELSDLPIRARSRSRPRPVRNGRDRRVGTRPRDTQEHTDQGDTLTAAVLLGIPTAPLAHVLDLPLGGATVCRPGAGLLATSVAVQDTAVDVAVALGAIQSVQAAHVRSPHLGPGPARGHDLRLTPLTRGTVEVELGLGLSVEVEGVTVGMTLGIADPGLHCNKYGGYWFLLLRV
ncbi:hypothetical protein V8B97DRAFT_1913828 [Scleroderma yunnanense]